MSEVENGDTAGHGPANAGRAEHPLRARARRALRHVAEVEAAFQERLRLLREQHEVWKVAATEEARLLQLEAVEAEERLSRDEAENGPAPGDAEEVRNLRATPSEYKRTAHQLDIESHL